MNNSVSLQEIVNMPRTPDSLNLVDEVAQYLKNAGLIKECEYFLNTPDIVLIKDKINILQRHVLNRYFTLQIYNTEINNPSIDGYGERYVLIADGTDQEWLSLFRRRVVPFLVAHSLPKPF